MEGKPMSAPLKTPLSASEKERFAEFFDGLAEEVRRTAEVTIFDPAPTVDQIVKRYGKD